jgi:poly-gamma-glutamate synthesis protein (capsule biosynthesis protein)
MIRRLTVLFILLAGIALWFVFYRPQPKPTPPPPPPEPPVITVAAVGDILLAGKAEKLSAQEGVGAPFISVKTTLASADLAIGNLECPLSGGGRPAEKTYTFRAPTQAIEDLQAAGIDVVCLANNHSLDYGRTALQDTLSSLGQGGLEWVGAGENLAQARQAKYFVFGEGKTKTRIALLAFSNMLPTDFYAGENRGGTVPALVELIKHDVGEAAKKADFTIVSFHWGKELSDRPTPGQRALAHLAIDSGADLILGHHPHVLQGVENYKKGIIAYSLGNFVFPSRSLTRESVILLAHFQKPEKITVELQPIWIEGCVPQPAAGETGEKILRRLAALSEPLAGELEIRDARARLLPSAPGK